MEIVTEEGCDGAVIDGSEADADNVDVVPCDVDGDDDETLVGIRSKGGRGGSNVHTPSEGTLVLSWGILAARTN